MTGRSRAAVVAAAILGLAMAPPTVAHLVQGGLREADDFDSPRGVIANSAAESRNGVAAERAQASP